MVGSLTRKGEVECIVMERWGQDQSGGIKWGEGWNRGVTEDISGGAADSEGHLRGHMEIYYLRSFLKDINK